MFKKITIAGMLAASILTANAQKTGKGMISNGFYLNLGLAFPSATFNTTASASASSGSSTTTATASSSSTQTLGVQPSIEIGNQWYFWKNDKMGVGLRVSWFQFGYSGYSTDLGPFGKINTGNVDLRFIKLAPQYTLGLNDNMALDFSFEIAPTLMIGANTFEPGPGVTATTNISGYSAFGLMFAPGAKFRFKKFAAGFDLGFGSLPFGSAGASATTSGTASGSTTASTGNAFVLYPRIYLGFKF